MLIKQEERDILCDRVFQNDHHIKKENENPLHCQGIVTYHKRVSSSLGNDAPLKWKSSLVLRMLLQP